MKRPWLRGREIKIEKQNLKKNKKREEKKKKTGGRGKGRKRIKVAMRNELPRKRESRIGERGLVFISAGTRAFPGRVCSWARESRAAPPPRSGATNYRPA